MKKLYVLPILWCVMVTIITAQTSSKSGNPFFSGQHNTSRSSGGLNYLLEVLSDTYTDLTDSISVNQGEIWDDPSYFVPVEFPFVLNLDTINLLEFFGVGAFLRSATSDPEVDAFVFPFEVDLIDRGAETGLVSLSPISYRVDTLPEGRILKLEWKNAGSYAELDFLGTTNMFVNFQLWLYEGSNVVEFRFGEHFIDDPELFYIFADGAFAGIANYNETEDIVIRPHFLTGPVDEPSLSLFQNSLEGTPANGTVYRLTLILPIELEVAGVNSTSVCEPNGSAEAIVTGGVAPYTYLWSNGETTAVINGLGAGTYGVTVTDQQSESIMGSVTLTAPEVLEANASATNETVPDANDGTATADATGGTAPYTYLWSNDSTTATITDLVPGDYTVTVTDDAGCTAEETVTVEAAECLALFLESEVTFASCFGVCDGTIIITNVNGGSAPFVYEWSNGGSTDTLHVCAGDYDVTITDNNGCVITESFTVGEPDEILVNISSTPESAPGANDGTASAAPTGGTEPYSFVWSNGGTDAQITELEPGTYDVTITDFNGCSATASVDVVTIDCSITATITDATCFQLCDGQIVVSLTSGLEPATFVWSNGATSDTLEFVCAGDYDVTVTDDTGCVATGSYTVGEPGALIVDIGSTNETGPGANDGTAWAIPSGGTPPYTYLWNISSTDSLIMDLEPGIYTVLVLDANDCAVLQNVEIFAYVCIDIADVTIIEASCFGICDGSISVVTDTALSISYLWSTGDTTPEILDLCAGTYDLILTDELKECSDTLSFNLTSPEALELVIDDITHVTDSTAGAISITVTGGTPPYTYSWTLAGNVISDEEDLTDLEAGPYGVIVSDAQGCFIVFDSIIVRDETVNITDPYTLQVRIYPNPVSDKLTIEIEDVNSFVVSLFTADGRQMHHWTNMRILDLSTFTPGFYTLRCISGSKHFIQPVVIMR